MSPTTSKSGFSLLELLIALTIMAAVAFMALELVGDDENALRYDQTNMRLRQIRAAIVGHTDSKLLAEGLQNGFVADNGCLPAQIGDLVTLSDDGVEYGPVAPIFYFKITDDGYFNGANTTQVIEYDEGTESMLKGQRAGYLTDRGLAGAFRDGWGNGTDEDPNHGWQVETNSSGAFVVASLGQGGLDFAQEMSPIAPEDWQVNLSGASVRIYNKTAHDFFFTSDVYQPGGAASNWQNPLLSAGLLIFDGSGEENFQWRRIESNPASGVNLWLDGDGDGVATVSGNSAPALDYIEVTFPPDTWVPVGEHLLVLAINYDVSSSGTTAGARPFHPGALVDEGEFRALKAWCSDSSYYQSAEMVTQRVRFFPNQSAPSMELELR